MQSNHELSPKVKWPKCVVGQAPARKVNDNVLSNYTNYTACILRKSIFDAHKDRANLNLYSYRDENFNITLVMYFSSEDIKIFSFPVPLSVITLRIHLSVTQMTYCWGVLRVCIIKRSENSLKCQHFNIQSNLYNCWKWYQTFQFSIASCIFTSYPPYDDYLFSKQFMWGYLLFQKYIY